MHVHKTSIVEPWLSRVYVICTQSAVLHKTAGRVQNHIHPRNHGTAGLGSR